MVNSCNRSLSILLALFFVLSSLAGSVNIAQASSNEPEHDYTLISSALGTDNVTSQSKNITSQDNVNIIDVDKITGKELRSESRIITLTPVQLAEIDKQIQDKKKLINKNLVRFRSGHSLNVSSGSIAEDIKSSAKANGKKPAGAGKSADKYYVIQFDDDMASVDRETRDLIKQSGCILYDHISNNAFFAKIPPEALDTVISLVNRGALPEWEGR
jgi:hypothetical protein